MSNEKNKTDNLDSVDQIRNILFGEQITVIEKRFEELEKSLSKSIQKISDKIDKSNKQLQADNSILTQQQSDDIKNLELAINNKIIETESELMNHIHSGLDKLDQKAIHRNDLAGLLKDVADKLAD